ncbi:MAG: hypothetical protein SFU27_04175 [Thermonemataceae bacterium]|nr:hypothetical protein [Thermonemataceae bacterium]
MRFLLVFFSLLSLIVACNKSEVSKMDLSLLKMQEGREMNANISFEMRCDCQSEPYLSLLQSDNAFAEREGSINEYLTELYKKPVDSINMVQMDMRFQNYLNAQQNNPPSITSFSKNWAGYGALKVFFLRKTSLTESEKALLASYMEMLIAVKNTNLPELADAVEKLEGYWNNTKVIQTAEVILTNYDSYNEDGYLDINSNEISQIPEEHNSFKQMLQELSVVDNQAKTKLRDIIERNK